jgi:hypothetical protein
LRSNECRESPFARLSRRTRREKLRLFSNLANLMGTVNGSSCEFTPRSSWFPQLLAFLNQKRDTSVGSVWRLGPLQTSPFLESQAEPPVLFECKRLSRAVAAATKGAPMADAADYRENAEICAAFADKARSPQDRAAWLLMSSAWLDLALVREYAVRRTPGPIELPPFPAVRRALTAVGIDKEAPSELGSDAAA